MTRPSPELLAETARLAFHFHWPLDTLLDLEHRDRRLFLAQAEGLAAASAVRAAPIMAPPDVMLPAVEPEGEPVAEAEVEVEVDLEAIKDDRVRKLFQTYFPAAS